MSVNGKPAYIADFLCNFAKNKMRIEKVSHENKNRSKTSCNDLSLFGLYKLWRGGESPTFG